jgi:hypothetical protein
VELDKVCQYFGVGLAPEDVAEFAETRAKRRVVFDDAVVDDGDPLRAVQVWVGIGIRGGPVRRPASVPDADRAGERLAVVQALGEARKLSLGLGTRQSAGRIDDRDAGAIVASILETPQRVEDDGNAVPLAYVSNDPANADLLDALACAPVLDLSLSDFIECDRDGFVRVDGFAVDERLAREVFATIRRR